MDPRTVGTAAHTGSRTLRASAGNAHALALVLLVMAGVLVHVGCARRLGKLLGADPDAPSVRQQVRILSLNTWLLPVVSRAMPERLARLPEALAQADPDVVCLQEVWSTPSRSALVAGFPAWHATPGQRGGLVTLSRWPIVEQRFVRFPGVEGLSLEERVAGKGLLECVVEAPTGRMRVVNTHAAWGDPGNEPHNDFLLQHVAPLEDLPLVVAGDLNHAMPAWAEGPSDGFRPWWEAGFAHVDPLVSGGWGDTALQPADRGLIPTRVGWPHGPGASGWTPDHVLCRDGGGRGCRAYDYRVLFRGPDEGLSDHCGLWCVVVLSP